MQYRVCMYLYKILVVQKQLVHEFLLVKLGMAVHYERTAHCAFDQATITTMYVRCWKACYVLTQLLTYSYIWPSKTMATSS